MRSVAPAVDLRDCRLYRFWGRDPWQRGIGDVILYVGETARAPYTRMMEHIYAQPWAADITGWALDEHVFPGKPAVLAAERAAIEAEQPIYNVEWNGRNPWRVDVTGQRGGLPQPYRRTTTSGRSPRPSRRRATWRGRVLGWASAWLALAAVIAWAAGQAMPAPNAALAGALTASAVVVKARSGRRRRRR